MMSEPPQIRKATVEDAQAVLEHMKRLNDDDHPGLLRREKLPPLDKERKFLESRLDGTGHILVLVDDHAIRGIGEVKLGSRPYRSHCATLGISLESSLRGRGFGTEMIRALHDWARRQPEVERVQLEVFSTNPGAIKLYERMGYVLEGRRVGAIKRGAESIDLIQMALAL